MRGEEAVAHGSQRRTSQAWHFAREPRFAELPGAHFNRRRTWLCLSQPLQRLRRASLFSSPWPHSARGALPRCVGASPSARSFWMALAKEIAGEAGTGFSVAGLQSPSPTYSLQARFVRTARNCSPPPIANSPVQTFLAFFGFRYLVSPWNHMTSAGLPWIWMCLSWMPCIKASCLFFAVMVSKP